MQQQGQQILDSIISSADDKVVGAALAEIKVMFDNMLRGNSASTAQLLTMADKLATMVSKNQLDISQWGMNALEGARSDLRALQNSGEFLLKIADETVGQAMTMAQSVARDQAAAQAQALQIVAEAKTGDYTDSLQNLSAMVMGFALLALMIVKGR